MTPEDIEAFAEHFVDAVQRGDADAMRACYAPGGVIWHNTDGIEQSIDDNVKVLEWFIRTLPDRTYTVLRREVIPDGFVQQHILSATLPTGELWKMDACVVVKMKDGLITTNSVVMRASSGTVRWVSGEHRNKS